MNTEPNEVLLRLILRPFIWTTIIEENPYYVMWP